jgi:hypothetical protein
VYHFESEDTVGRPSISVHSENLWESGKVQAHVLVRVLHDEDRRTPCDVCCVLDISTSMEATAQVKDKFGERGRLTSLDVAKHGVLTVIHTLSSRDRLAIVAFNHNATVTLALTAMDLRGQTLATEKLEMLKACGATDLWSGLQTALELMRGGREDGPQERNRLGHIMLLTDGVSDGDVELELALYLDRHGRFPVPISTFGFGYEIDSTLLSSLALSGAGAYSFIPDADFVGTVFVNTISNILVTSCQDAELTLQGQDVEIHEVLGEARHRRISDSTVVVRLDYMQYGQCADVLVRVRQKPTLARDCATPYLVATLHLGTVASSTGELDPVSVAAVPTDVTKEEEVIIARSLQRCAFVTVLTCAQAALGQEHGESSIDERLVSSRAMLVQFIEDLENFADRGEALDALLEDAKGQALEALSLEEFYQKWGAHFLPSLISAHRLQICNNFKDPGVQVYGGAAFRRIQEAADELFSTLAPPKRNHRALPVNMATYNDRYAGCIDGACPARLSSGAKVRVCDLTRGDLVAGGAAAVAEVECVVRIPCRGCTPLVALPGGARVTPYHPVLIDGAWRFPADVGDARTTPCEAVYCFVLRGACALVVGDTPCIGLGHGLTGAVVGHRYWGTELVLADLAEQRGFEDGRVELLHGWTRDPDTGLVTGVAGV